MSTLLGVPSDIQLIAGPLLLGYLFNWGLFGVLCIQVYMYYLAFPKDSRVIKILVYFLFFTDIVQTALTTHNAWHFLASGWGDPGALTKPGWSWIAVPLLSGIVSATVQLFFSWRIWKLSANWMLACAIAVVALTQGICAMISGIWFSLINDVTKISSLFPTATIWLGGSALTDVLITTSLVYHLRKSSTGFEATDNVITRLIRMTIETGAVTACAATAELILYLVYKENNLHMIPALALAKLYTNTLLATLNSRNPVFQSSTHRTSSNAWNGGVSTIPRNYFGRAPVDNVTIMTTQETHRDSIQAGGPNFAMRDIKNGGFSHDSGNLTATDNESTKKYFSSRDSTEDVEAGRL